MNPSCLVSPTQECWYTAMNELIQVLGSKKPIKLGYCTYDRQIAYFWYNDENRFPVFKNTNLGIALSNLPITQVEPNDIIVFGQKIYYFSPKDLSIYRIANFLDIVTVVMFAKINHLEPSSISLMRMYIPNQVDEIPVWKFNPIPEEGEEWKISGMPKLALPVFEDDSSKLNEFQEGYAQMQNLVIGDTVVHGDKLYKLGLNPNYGIAFEEQDIEFDVNELFNLKKQ